MIFLLFTIIAIWFVCSIVKDFVRLRIYIKNHIEASEIEQNLILSNYKLICKKNNVSPIKDPSLQKIKQHLRQIKHLNSTKCN